MVDPDPDPVPPLTIVARPPAQDTVLAEPVQAIVVALRRPDGAPMPGVVVRFASLLPAAPGVAFVWVRLPTDNLFSGFAAPATDARGQALAQIKHGPVSGTGRVVVSVPEFGLADTLEFTMRPGAAARLEISPRDTAIAIGRSVQARSRVLDRYGNSSSGSVTFTSFTTPAGSGASDASGRVTGTAPGRVGIVANAGSLSDTAYVSVVPSGTIAARDDVTGALVLVELDGSGRTVILPGATSPHVEPAWSPNGTELAIAPSGVSREIQLVSATGVASRVNWPPAAGAADPYWPAFDRSGRIYFSNVQFGTPTGIWRVRRDGTGLEETLTCLCYRPSPSPDGRFVTLHAVASNGSDIVVQVFDLQTRGQVGAEVPGRFPEWSPTGARIAFVGNDTGRLWVMAPGGANRRIVSDSERFYVSQQLAWSPDGAWILALSNAGLDLIDADTGLTLPLAWASGLSQPAWKP